MNIALRPTYPGVFTPKALGVGDAAWAHVAIYIWVININLLNTVILELINVLKKDI